MILLSAVCRATGHKKCKWQIPVSSAGNPAWDVTKTPPGRKKTSAWGGFILPCRVCSRRRGFPGSGAEDSRNPDFLCQEEFSQWHPRIPRWGRRSLISILTLFYTRGLAIVILRVMIPLSYRYHRYGEGSDAIQRGEGLPAVGGGVRLMTHSVGTSTAQIIALKYVMASEPYRYTWYLKQVMAGCHILKVVGNEKLGGLRFLQLLSIGLGPWRTMSIFILNMSFANAKHISVSALSSKMNRRFVCN